MCGTSVPLRVISLPFIITMTCGAPISAFKMENSASLLDEKLLEVRKNAQFYLTYP